MSESEGRAGRAASLAFGALLEWRDCGSHAELVRRHKGKPLVEVRCGRCGAHAPLLASVWRTPAGPLLVSSHTAGTWPPGDRAEYRIRGADRAAWAPRLWLLETATGPGDALPLHCPQCFTARPLTEVDVRRLTDAAKRTNPRRVVS